MTSQVTVSAHLDVLKSREFDLLTKAQLREVERKLVAKPDYGKPLNGPLAGFYRLRVGDIRVVYRIMAADQVQIVAIGPRRDDAVYKTAVKRS